MKTKLCGCGEYIVFLKNEETDKYVPVRTEFVDEDDTEFDPGKHENHFGECSDADRYSKSKRKA